VHIEVPAKVSARHSAQAGIQLSNTFWAPAFAGVTMWINEVFLK